MSGVGSASDINLPKEQPPPPQKSRFGFGLSFRQLNALSFMLVLSFSGLVPLQHISIVILSTFYIYFLSKFSFPTHNNTTQKPIFSQNNKTLKTYVLFAAIIGLLLPILYIFEGILEGDKQGIKVAVPHLFLLASQVFMEGVSVSNRFSIPIRVFVPVFYNSVRMFTLFEWFNQEFFRVGNSTRLYFGKGLAIVNLGFWSFNLFGFLLPVYLPKAFQRYYGDNGPGSKND